MTMYIVVCHVCDPPERSPPRTVFDHWRYVHGLDFEVR